MARTVPFDYQVTTIGKSNIEYVIEIIGKGVSFETPLTIARDSSLKSSVGFNYGFSENNGSRNYNKDESIF